MEEVPMEIDELAELGIGEDQEMLTPVDLGKRSFSAAEKTLESKRGKCQTDSDRK